jgi:hypothetical protein
VLSQYQEGYRLRIAVAQVHHASLRVAIVIQVGQTASTGILHFVLGHLKTQAVAIKLQRAFEITDAQSDVRYG